MLITLLVGGAGLASTTNPNPPITPLVTSAFSALPAYARTAASRTVALTITTPGHVLHVAAMALPYGLAVTTTPIPNNALVTATIPHHINFPVKWIGRDKTLGFSIVRLSVHVTPLSLAPLPVNAAVMAISPVVKNSASPPRFAWARTTLGDPVRHTNGNVSYLATASDKNLSDFVDAIAINSSGQVVAVLSTGHLWYSAQFVAQVAEIFTTGFGCHSTLNVKGINAQGGGALVKSVKLHGTSQGRLMIGDVITQINGHDIDSWNTLLGVLYLTPAQSQVPVTYVRNAKIHHTVITLACAI